MGSIFEGISPLFHQTKEDYEASIGLFKEAIALDPTLSHCAAYLATIMLQGIHSVDPEHARIMDHGDEPGRKQRPA